MVYDERGARNRRRREVYAEISEVGPIPDVVDPDRRESFRLSLFGFLTNYFPESTGLNPFSQDHKEMIDRLQMVILKGGRNFDFVYRGFGKTTIIELACLWALLYAHRRFVVLLGFGNSDAEQNLDSIKAEIESNDLLYEDFPEICHAIRELEGKPQRCSGQTIDGERTHITWTGDKIVFPTVYYPAEIDIDEVEDGGEVIGQIVPKENQRFQSYHLKNSTFAVNEHGELIINGKPSERVYKLNISARTEDGDMFTQQVEVKFRYGKFDQLIVVKKEIPSSGATVFPKSFLKCRRGLKHKTQSGKNIRPDLVIVDDWQDDESAASETQCEKRIQKLYNTILNLSGHKKKIALYGVSTIIEPGDASDQMLNDRDRHKSFVVNRTEMVKSWSDHHDTLWLEDYARIRCDFDPDVLGDRDRAYKEANQFYQENREKMDQGCSVSWKYCYDDEEELSAIQHAYNFLIDNGEEAFSSECQNNPERAKTSGLKKLDAKVIAAKVGRHNRFEAPSKVEYITVSIDVGKTLLWYTAIGWANHFEGYLMDYGAWPEQPKRIYSKRKAPRTLGRVYRKMKMDAMIYKALQDLSNHLVNMPWQNDDGSPIQIRLGLIDAMWEESRDTVYRFCKEEHRGLFMPFHGLSIKASDRPFGTSKPKDGQRFGKKWMIGESRGKGEVRHVTADVNYWKTKMCRFYESDYNEKESLHLYRPPKSSTTHHTMYGQHMAAEVPREKEHDNRTVTEFILPTTKPDNDLFDTTNMCIIGASILGNTFEGELIKQPKKKKRRVRSRVKSHTI